MIPVQNILFKPGRILATPACLEELDRAGQDLWEFIEDENGHRIASTGILPSES